MVANGCDANRETERRDGVSNKNEKDPWKPFRAASNPEWGRTSSEIGPDSTVR